MRRFVLSVGVAAVVAVQGIGCGGGGSACQDLVTAIDKAAMQPGCNATQIAGDMQNASTLLANCDPSQDALHEQEASCFNAVMNCEGGEDGQAIRTLAECLQRAGASQQ